MNNFKKIFIWLLMSLPGIYFAVTGGHDPFAAIAVIVVAFVLAVASGYTFAILAHVRALYAELETAKKNVPSKLVTTMSITLWGWVIIVVAAFVLGGTSGFGIAIYGAIIGLLDRSLRRDMFDKGVDELLSDKSKTE